MTLKSLRLATGARGAVAALALLALPAPLALAQPAPAGVAPTYADLADLADSASLVVHARVRKLVRVEAERAPGLRPGYGRFYVTADTIALLTGSTPIGQSFSYLVDLPLDRAGKPMVRKKDAVFLFARTVPGRAAELQLVQRNGQVASNPELEQRIRAILTARLAPDAPGPVRGVREIIHVPGTLAGEGETQIFLNTKDSSAASITVRHQPGQPPVWGVSFSELVAQVGRPPARDTLEWYRLACFLPPAPPPGANMSEGPVAQRQAEVDYRYVMAELGPCQRTS